MTTYQVLSLIFGGLCAAAATYTILRPWLRARRARASRVRVENDHRGINQD